MRGLEAMINAFKNSKFCDKIFYYKKKISVFLSNQYNKELWI